MGFIYIITCIISGMVYIGQTKWPVEKRWKSHIKCGRMLIEARKNNQLKALKYKNITTSVVYNTMADNGVENFVFDILAEVPNTKLNQYEVMYIKEWNCKFPNGLNMTMGGSSFSNIGVSIEKSKATKAKNIDQHRHELLKGMPVHFVYNPKDDVIALKGHPLCAYKRFAAKSYGGIENAREAALEFLSMIESIGIPYVKPRKLGEGLQPGVYEILPGKYRVFRQIDNITYRKDFTQDSPEENLRKATEYAKDPKALGPYQPRVKLDPTLEAGIIPVHNGYKVQKQINNRSYRRKFTSTKISAEEKLQMARAYLKEISEAKPES